MFRGTFALDEPEFDWGAGYARPAIPPQDLVIYEMGVRSFTADAPAGVPPEDAGTFRGLQAKARPWAWLGRVAAGGRARTRSRYVGRHAAHRRRAIPRPASLGAR